MRWPRRSAPRRTRRAAWTPGCATRCTRPRTTAIATCRAPSWPSARAPCPAPTPNTASPTSPPAARRHAQKRRVRLCAPAGKAARRLAEITGAPATTIHRLLEYAPDEGFARGPEDPIPGTDVLIVDEASMLSVRLAEALFGAV